MISVGIDVSKGKSTVCILKPNEDFVCKPFELLHNKENLELLDELLKKLDGEVKVVMEATGIYNLPILTFLVEKGYFVSVINPCVMKKYARNNNFRNVKTDKRDSVTIANYGIEKWFKLQKYECSEGIETIRQKVSQLYGNACKSPIRAHTCIGLCYAGNKESVQQLDRVQQQR